LTLQLVISTNRNGKFLKPEIANIAPNNKDFSLNDIKEMWKGGKFNCTNTFLILCVTSFIGKLFAVSKNNDNFAIQFLIVANVPFDSLATEGGTLAFLFLIK